MSKFLFSVRATVCIGQAMEAPFDQNHLHTSQKIYTTMALTFDKSPIKMACQMAQKFCSVKEQLSQRIRII